MSSGDAVAGGSPVSIRRFTRPVPGLIKSAPILGKATAYLPAVQFAVGLLIGGLSVLREPALDAGAKSVADFVTPFFSLLAGPASQPDLFLKGPVAWASHYTYVRLPYVKVTLFVVAVIAIAHAVICAIAVSRYSYRYFHDKAVARAWLAGRNFQGKAAATAAARCLLALSVLIVADFAWLGVTTNILVLGYNDHELQNSFSSCWLLGAVAALLGYSNLGAIWVYLHLRRVADVAELESGLQENQPR